MKRPLLARLASALRGASPVDAAAPATPALATPAPAPVASPVPREVMRQVRLIELRTRGWVESLFGGEYQSVFKGQGMEFVEVREYQPGDDVRNIEWNVTARIGSPFVKRHVEERELTVLLAVDLSGSGQFGTRGGRFKAELAAEIAAVLALSAVRNHDRVGLLLFTDHVEHFVPPGKGQRHALRLIRDVLAFTPTGRGTDLAGALDYAGRLLRHRAIVFVLSDFQRPTAAEGAHERTLRALSRRHDMIAITLADVAEEALPDVGLVSLVDPETGEELFIDTGAPGLRALYARRATAEREARQRLFRKLAIDEIEVRTDSSYIAPLLAFFRRRERLLKR